MACANCSSKGGTPAGCKNNGTCSSGGCNKMGVFNWLSNMELPTGQKPFDGVEVRFKNGRKGIYKNQTSLPVYEGDIVVVESSPGHDVGVVSLTGELVKHQISRKNINFDSSDIRKIYRKARQEDIEKWKEARSLEETTMHRARTLALKHGLQMKISDVEYQGDRLKATFYYTADDRVDFRELIKTMAEEFKVRVEMRQIGARQEAGRLGGIGSCGRELCCATWLVDFRTVSTSAARYQQLSLNPQKLAGQCGKLKCCLNYELDMYVEAFKHFPENNVRLQTKKGMAFHQKTDLFKKKMWYTLEGSNNFIELDVERVKKIIELNKKGVIPEDLIEEKVYTHKEIKTPDYENVVGQDSLTRFDEKKNKNKNRHHRNKKHQNKPGNQQQPQNQNKVNQPQHQKGNQQQNKGNQQPQKGPHPHKGHHPNKGNDKKN